VTCRAEKKKRQEDCAGKKKKKEMNRRGTMAVRNGTVWLVYGSLFKV
jgi:hypothetical protein